MNVNANSKRAKRMQTRHRRHGKVSLNLVSLMDIFTILVFFLLVNSSDAVYMPNTRGVILPESTAEQAARETVVVTVTANAIEIDGRPIANLRDIERQNSPVIAELQRVLINDMPARVDGVEREITIVGDKSVRYAVLRKVMASCASADFDRVSLAVIDDGSEVRT